LGVRRLVVFILKKKKTRLEFNANARVKNPSDTLREHKDRTHFTLLEKLPKFYHEAKNREGVLKIIAKLNNK
jgi:hypothetical protein